MTHHHYPLFANNQLPLQLYVYEEYKKFTRSAHNKLEQEDLKFIGDRMQEVMDDPSRLFNTREGESLSNDVISDVYLQVMGEHRARTNTPLTTKSKTGEISDYFEMRRLFGAAQ